MTFAVLRALHAIIGDALDDMERVYASRGSSTTPEATRSETNTPETSPTPAASTLGHRPSLSTSKAYVSPPPSPCLAVPPSSIPPEPLDFPSLDDPCDPTSLSEVLTAHPTVAAAIGRIVAATGQMGTTVQVPFLTLCDASMGYHLPSCLRLLEASHVVEILREAGGDGLHVDAISEKNGTDPKKLAHILRLLATHHILREISPDVFGLNRISSLVDSGKSFQELKKFQDEGQPEGKYRDTNGVAAFIGLCADEINKSSAYLTETYFLSPHKHTRSGFDPVQAPFCFAFDTLKTRTGFFGWLEGVDRNTNIPSLPQAPVENPGIETGQGSAFSAVKQPEPIKPTPKYPLPLPQKSPLRRTGTLAQSHGSPTASASQSPRPIPIEEPLNPNRFRLERFGKAMSGTEGWEAPGAVFQGFEWESLPYGSIVVDVGGGIGSTSMLLASAFSSSSAAGSNASSPLPSPGGERRYVDTSASSSIGLGSESPMGPRLKFIIQDRPPVCEMGEKAWIAKCPELLNSVAKFQVHDFFTPQPILNAAVFLLRVVLHDWPDEFARRILLQLRKAALPTTKLLIADFVLPLACRDEVSATDNRKNGGSGGDVSGILDDVEGAESVLAPPPLLPNLGKASANVYWMDMTMQVMFNAQERTLRETVQLAASAGWKVTRVTKSPNSLFGHIVAHPVDIPPGGLAILEREEKGSWTPGWQHDAVSPPTSGPSTPLMAGQPFAESLGSERKNLRAARKHDRPIGGDGFDDDDAEAERSYRSDLDVRERASSRCGTPTFGSRMRLSSVQEAFSRYGAGVGIGRIGGGPGVGGVGAGRNMMRLRAAAAAAPGAMGRSLTAPAPSHATSYGHGHGGLPPVPPLKPALSLTSATPPGGGKRKKPSPLAVVTPPGVGIGVGLTVQGSSSALPSTSPSTSGILPTPLSAGFGHSAGDAGDISPVGSHSPTLTRSRRMTSLSPRGPGEELSGIQPPHSPAPRVRTMTRRLSLANLRSSGSMTSPVPPVPALPPSSSQISMSPTRLQAQPHVQQTPSHRETFITSSPKALQKTIRRRASHAQLSSTSLHTHAIQPSFSAGAEPPLPPPPVPPLLPSLASPTRGNTPSSAPGAITTSHSGATSSTFQPKHRSTLSVGSASGSTTSGSSGFLAPSPIAQTGLPQSGQPVWNPSTNMRSISRRSSNANMGGSAAVPIVSGSSGTTTPGPVTRKRSGTVVGPAASANYQNQNQLQPAIGSSSNPISTSTVIAPTGPGRAIPRTPRTPANTSASAGSSSSASRPTSGFSSSSGGSVLVFGGASGWRSGTTSGHASPMPVPGSSRLTAPTSEMVRGRHDSGSRSRSRSPGGLEPGSQAGMRIPRLPSPGVGARGTGNVLAAAARIEQRTRSPSPEMVSENSRT